MQRDRTKTVNYTSVFLSKLSFRISFQKWTIPYTFEVEELAIFGVSMFIVRYVLGGIIDGISSVTFLNSYVLSLAGAYGLTRLIQFANTDGKRIDRYLIDMLSYFFEVILTKKVLYKGRYRRIKDDPIIYKTD